MTGFLKYYDHDYDRHQPLKYRHGDEKAKSVVVYSSVVSLDDDSRRLVNRGAILCEITSGDGDGKYGPYLKTAADGRQTLARGSCVVASKGLDVTLGDRPIGGWFADCIFDKSELTTGGISTYGTSLTSLQTAFAQCEFED
jgi:hypothetical protein